MSQRRGKTSSWTVFDLTTSASVQPLDRKMSQRRGKTSGWTAFDLEHRHKQGLEPEAMDESFPAISSSMDQSQKALTNTENRIVSEKKPKRGKMSCWTVFDLTTSASVQPVDKKMSQRRGKTSGWTAFDLEHRHKQGLEPEAMDESFPAISCSTDQSQKALTNTENRTASEKKPKHSDMHEKKLQGGGSSGVKDALKEMLKELHPWADQCLIDDVLAGVDYDVDKDLFKMMVSSEQKYNNIKISGTEELKFNHKKSLVNENKSLAEKDTDLSQVRCLLEGLVLRNNQDLTDEHASSRRMLLHDVFATKMILNSINSLPIEPEREEDNVYLVQRKEARKMTSSASRNSKAANEAYLRGDHLSAQLYSRKAREEWMTAKQLNAKAAKEILSIRNSKNDEWTLDLHGLHAAEAVQALQEHLQRIESQMPTKQLSCARRVNVCQMPTTRIVNLCQLPTIVNLCQLPTIVNLCQLPTIVNVCQMPTTRRVNVCQMPTTGRFNVFESQMPTKQLACARSVQVITGKGKHSRGEAALPPAIRSFLNENRYHYSEAQPGVIEVQVKFR